MSTSSILAERLKRSKDTGLKDAVMAALAEGGSGGGEVSGLQKMGQMMFDNSDAAAARIAGLGTAANRDDASGFQQVADPKSAKEMDAVKELTSGGLSNANILRAFMKNHEAGNTDTKLDAVSEDLANTAPAEAPVDVALDNADRGTDSGANDLKAELAKAAYQKGDIKRYLSLMGS
ncbi:hypothetical protein AGMMS49573_09390 [Endomicrobiia bacterium]|nr:hypothetical protein AGMMS49573_09390 [Endomicrobiia bacterium]